MNRTALLAARIRKPCHRLFFCLCSGILLLFFSLASLIPGVAVAETVTIPSQVRVIEAGAYEGCTAITSVSLPDGLLEIGASAFAGCASLHEVTIPSSVEVIGEGAFPSGCRLLCYEGTPSAIWAAESGYDVTFITAPPAFYALLIGQTYEHSAVTPVLEGPRTDLRAMQAMLSSMPGTPYQITSVSNLSADEIRNAILNAFADAEEQDVCLLYYSGHGYDSTLPSRRGALVGTDNQLMTMPTLRSLLDGIPGDKILLFDSCYSGSILDTASSELLAETSARNQTASLNGKMVQSEQVSSDLDAVNASIISVFSAKKRGVAVSGDYYIITAATAAETSNELYDTASSQYYGAFTYGLTYGSGYNELTGLYLTNLRADSNKDQAISLQEAYIFAYSMAASIVSSQHAQVYPTNCAYTLWAR